MTEKCRKDNSNKRNNFIFSLYREWKISKLSIQMYGIGAFSILSLYFTWLLTKVVCLSACLSGYLYPLISTIINLATSCFSYKAITSRNM